MNPVDKLRQLCRTHSLDFRNCGDGHLQVSGHGVLVNYWPESRRPTAQVKDGPTIRHCKPYDVIKLALEHSDDSLKPECVDDLGGEPKNVQPGHTNPAGIRHTYTGTVPPWEGPSVMAASDALRILAHKMDYDGAIDSNLYQQVLEAARL